jgi:hypothetical protein
VWNGIKDTAKDVAMRAVPMIGEWRAVNRMQQNNSNTVAASAQTREPGTVTIEALVVSRVTEHIQWQRPRFGWWKCSQCESVKTFKSHELGMVYSDANGSFIAAGSNRST